MTKRVMWNWMASWNKAYGEHVRYGCIVAIDASQAEELVRAQVPPHANIYAVALGGNRVKRRVTA